MFANGTTASDRLSGFLICILRGACIGYRDLCWFDAWFARIDLCHLFACLHACMRDTLVLFLLFCGFDRLRLGGIG